MCVCHINSHSHKLFHSPSSFHQVCVCRFWFCVCVCVRRFSAFICLFIEIPRSFYSFCFNITHIFPLLSTHLLQFYLCLGFLLTLSSHRFHCTVGASIDFSMPCNMFMFFFSCVRSMGDEKWLDRQRKKTSTENLKKKHTHTHSNNNNKNNNNTKAIIWWWRWRAKERHTQKKMWPSYKMYMAHRFGVRSSKDKCRVCAYVCMYVMTQDT